MDKSAVILSLCLIRQLVSERIFLKFHRGLIIRYENEECGAKNDPVLYCYDKYNHGRAIVE